MYTDWFKSDGREESIDHEVDFLPQVRHTEVLQQGFFAAQTVDHHTESQPTQTEALYVLTNFKLTLKHYKKSMGKDKGKSTLTVTVTSIC